MKFIARSYHLLVGLFVISLPISKAVNSITLALLCLVSLYIFFKNSATFPRFIPALWPVLFFLLFVPSLAVSHDLSQGVWFLYRQSIYLALPVCLYMGRAYWLQQVGRYFKWFILSNAAVSVLTLIFFALPEPTVVTITDTIPGFMDYVQMTSRIKFGLYSPFIDRLHFAYLLGMSLLCLIYLFLGGHRAEWQVFSTITISITFLLLGGRGAQLGLLFGAVIWISQYSGQYLARQYPQFSFLHRRLIQQFIVALYLVTVPLVVYNLLGPVKTRYQQLFWELKLIQNGDYRNWDYQHFTSLRRLLSVKHHLTLIRKNLMFGTGVGDFRKDLQAAYQADQSLELKIDANANNKFLFILANAGLLGLSIFLLTLFGITRQLWAIPHGPLRQLALAFGIFIVVSWLFDIFTVYQVGASFFCFFITLFLLHPAPESSASV